MKKTLVILGLVTIGLLSSCTENERAKAFGGTMTIDLPPKTKLVNATWKDTHLWYLYRPARPGETPETTTFQEDSSFGVLEGKVIFTEK